MKKQSYAVRLHYILTQKSLFELKKGNNEAFAYARNLQTLGIPEIIEINAMVNNEAGIHRGFKTSDNAINGAPFLPCPKELVPMRMQELLYKYNHLKLVLFLALNKVGRFHICR